MAASIEPAEEPAEPAEPAPPLSPAEQRKAVSAAALRDAVQGLDVPLAVALETALERSLGDFARDHEKLVRAACDVPDSNMDLREVVLCTFFGHVLCRLEQSRGRVQTALLADTLLEQFERARGHVGVLTAPPAGGTPQ